MSYADGVFLCHSRNVPTVRDATMLKMLSNLWDICSYPNLKWPAVFTCVFSLRNSNLHT